jgi:hypothetical protein
VLTRETLPNGGLLLTSTSSRTVFRELRPAVVLIVAAGPGDQELNAEVLRQLSGAIERTGPLTIFADMSKLSSISLGSLDDSTKWVRENHASVAAGHLLVSHVAVSMVVAMIRAAFGGSVRSYTQQALFEAAIRDLVPEYAGDP